MEVDIYKIAPEIKYGVIYSDPPWKQEKILRKCRPNQKRDFDYPTLDNEEITRIHETALMHSADKCNVFLWTIDKYLHDAEDLMHELGLSLHTRFIWDKGNGVAPCYTVRFSHEYLLWFYKKGHILRPSDKTRGKYMTVIHAPSTGHSRKPYIVYEMLDNMFPNVKKLELFARNQKLGWDCWGNDVNHFPTAC